jgi:hypothetical protein
MAIDLTHSDIDVLLESLNNGIRNVRDAPYTPYAVRARKPPTVREFGGEAQVAEDVSCTPRFRSELLPP